MVAFDELFDKDLEEMNDKKLSIFRKEQVRNLFNGDKGSQANVEREALIKEVDIERERRFKKRAETLSVLALIVSFIAMIVAILF